MSNQDVYEDILRECAKELKPLGVIEMKYRIDFRGDNSLELFLTMRAGSSWTESNAVIDCLSDIHSGVVDDISFTYDLAVQSEHEGRKRRTPWKVVNYPMG